MVATRVLVTNAVQIRHTYRCMYDSCRTCCTHRHHGRLPCICTRVWAIASSGIQPCTPACWHGHGIAYMHEGGAPPHACSRTKQAPTVQCTVPAYAPYTPHHTAPRRAWMYCMRCSATLIACHQASMVHACTLMQCSMACMAASFLKYGSVRKLKLQRIRGYDVLHQDTPPAS